MIHPSEIRDAFRTGANVSALLREHSADGTNTAEAIETAYDLQAGSYIAGLGRVELRAHKRRYGAALASRIEALTAPDSVLEAGVGEGTTLSFVLDAFTRAPRTVHGFDISWSRLAYCRRWLRARGHGGVALDLARLDRLPYADDSFDVVYTSHTIESNGGREREMLRELHRVSSRYLILLEPGYELATDEARSRMDSHGYCRALVATAEAEGMRVIDHALLGHDANPLNPTAITVIEKDARAPDSTPRYTCPAFGDALAEHTDSLHSTDSLRAYPKLHGIPCLRPEDAIVASAYERFAPDDELRP